MVHSPQIYVAKSGKKHLDKFTTGTRGDDFEKSRVHLLFPTAPPRQGAPPPTPQRRGRKEKVGSKYQHCHHLQVLAMQHAMGQRHLVEKKEKLNLNTKPTQAGLSPLSLSAYISAPLGLRGPGSRIGATRRAERNGEGLGPIRAPPGGGRVQVQVGPQKFGCRGNFLSQIQRHWSREGQGAPWWPKWAC